MARPRRRKTPAPPRPPDLSASGRALVLCCFFLSGATSLMFQVAWSKMLGVVLGGTLYAISTVVAAYMAGLGIGSFLGGRFADRVARRLRLYGLVEGWVGVFGLISPVLFPALQPVFRLLYDAEGAAGSPLLLVRFVVLFAVMMIPTLAMGCTLPLLVSFLQGHDARFGRHVGRLYSVNTLGAVAGTWLAGFAFIPALGLRATVIVAGVVNLLILGVILLARLPEPAAGREAPARADAEPEPAAPVSPAVARLVLALFAVSGALALTYEIAWTRALAVVIGSSTYSFSTILGTYLVGVGAGALLVSRWIGRWRDPVRILGWMQAALGALVVAGTFVVPHLGALFARLLLASVQPETGVAPGSVFGASLLLAALLVLPPSLLLGAIFPTAVAVVHRAGQAAGASVGRAYALNTVGTIVGSVLAGFLLLETFGTQRTLLGAAAGTFLVGAILLSFSGGVLWRRLVPAALLLAVGAAAVTLPPAWDPARTNAGISRILRNAVFSELGAEAVDHLALSSVVFAKEGRQTAVVVTETGEERTLWVSGKPDASTHGDLETQILLGQVPTLLADEPEDVLVIGYGSGATAGSVLTHPVRRVDTLEIEPVVIEASSWFDEMNGRPLEDPRHRVVLEDGRTWLQYSGRRYDVIISEPSNPWMAGVGNLFTREFYEQVLASLSEGGVFCQWLQLYEMSPDTTWSIVRALLASFTDAEVFVVNAEGDALLVARRGAGRTGFATMADRIARKEVSDDLARLNIQDPFDLVMFFRGSLRALLPRGDGPTNTDNNAYVEFRAPRDLFGGAHFHGFKRPPAQGAGALARFFPDLSHGEALLGVGEALVRNGRFAEAELLEGRMRDSDLAEVELLRETIMEALGLPTELRGVFDLLRDASAARARGDHEAALAILDQADREVPGEPHVAFRRGLELLAIGNSGRPGAEDYQRRAWDIFNHAVANPPEGDDYPAYINLGIIQCARGQLKAGLFFFDNARRIDPERGDAYWYAGLALRDLGETARARRTFLEGYAREPLHPGLRSEASTSAAGARPAGA